MKTPNLKNDFEKNYESGNTYRRNEKKAKIKKSKKIKVKNSTYWRGRYNKLVSFSFAMFALCIIEYIKSRDIMSIALLFVVGVITSGFAYYSKLKMRECEEKK